MPNRTGYYIDDQFGTYFLTFTIVGWVDVFTRRQCKDIVIEALRYCMKHKGLVLNAYVLMESHLHLIASAKEGSTGLSAIVRDFKRHTEKSILKWVKKSGSESRRDWMLMVFAYHAKHNSRNSDYQVWIQDNQPKRLLHPKFTLQKLSYIHENPVEAGIIDQAEAYLYSSARNYAGRKDYVLPVQIIDFGITEGYVKL